MLDQPHTKKSFLALPLVRIALGITLLAGPGSFASPAQQGAYCPLIPQAKTALSSPSSYPDGILDLTGQNLRPSARLRVAHASPKDLVFIDGETLQDAESLRAVQQSNATIFLKTSQKAEAAKSLIDRSVLGVAVLAALPKNKSGVANIYRTETASHPIVVQQYAKLAGEFSVLANTRVLSEGIGPVSIRQTILQEASARQPNHLLIVVGHNEKGELKLPDGSRVTPELCTERASRAVVPFGW